MKCKSPILTPNTGQVPVGCGQCLACRINDRRVWTHRMMLEQSSHTQNAFLTITYSDENLPKEFMDEETGVIYSDNSVNPYHLKKFIHRLRSAWRRSGGKNFRYFAVGEYGDKTGRPHYHLALFGFPTCTGVGSQLIDRTYVPCSCDNCKFVSKVWGLGHISLDTLSQQSAAYIAGYVTKKLTSDKTDHQWNVLQGRYPEFSRQSRNKGIGHAAILEYASRIKPYIYDRRQIPPYITHEGKKWPLGEYLHNTLVSALGFEYKEGEKLKEYKEGLLDMFEDTKVKNPLIQRYLEAGLPEAAIRVINAQSALQLEKKQELFKSNPKKRGL